MPGSSQTRRREPTASTTWRPVVHVGGHARRPLRIDANRSHRACKARQCSLTVACQQQATQSATETKTGRSGDGRRSRPIRRPQQRMRRWQPAARTSGAAADSASRIPFWACAHRTWSGPHVSFKQNTIPSRHTNGSAAVGSGSALRSAGTAPIQHAAGVALGMATGYLPQRIPCDMVSNAVRYPTQHGIRELDGVVRSAVDVQVRRGGAERRVRVHELQPSTTQAHQETSAAANARGLGSLGIGRRERTTT